MEQSIMGESAREVIKSKLRQTFDGKIVRKDLTKKIKEGAGYFLITGEKALTDEEREELKERYA